MTIHVSPCCHKPVDVPVNVAELEQSLVICPHCGGVLDFHDEALHLHEKAIDTSLASLLNMLQDMQAHPENYPGGESSAAGRAVSPAPGVH